MELRIYELETEQRWNFLQWFEREVPGAVARFISFRDDNAFVSLHDVSDAVPVAPAMVRKLTVHRLATVAPFDAARVAALPVIELRLYRIAPGMRARFRQFFNERTLEAQERSGMSVCGQFDDLDDENVFVWLRGFPDLLERDRRKADFYQSAYWLAELQDEAFSIIEDYSNTLLVTPVLRGRCDARFASGDNLRGRLTSLMPEARETWAASQAFAIRDGRRSKR